MPFILVMAVATQTPVTVFSGYFISGDHRNRLDSLFSAVCCGITNLYLLMLSWILIIFSPKYARDKAQVSLCPWRSVLRNHSNFYTVLVWFAATNNRNKLSRNRFFSKGFRWTIDRISRKAREPIFSNSQGRRGTDNLVPQGQCASHGAVSQLDLGHRRWHCCHCNSAFLILLYGLMICFKYIDLSVIKDST